MGIKESLRNYFMRVSGAELEIAEAEAKEENARRDLIMVIEEAGAVREARMDYLAVVLTGKCSPLDEGGLERLGINDALIRVGRERFGEVKKLGEKIEKLRGKYFSYVAESVCETEGVRKVPVMVYSDGHIVYTNRKFERRVPSNYLFGVSLKENEELGVALRKGKGFEIESEKGKLVFVPREKKAGDINVAYFLPEESRLRGRVDAFKKKSEQVARKVYEKLKGREIELA